MRHTFKSMRDFLKARDAQPELYVRFDLSPGGAGSLLHISRQRICQLISTPHLDAAVTADGYVLLDYAQVLQRKRRLRLAGGLDSVKRRA